MTRIDDLDLIRTDYADPTRLQTRFKPFREWHEGPDLDQGILEAVELGTPRRALEVGCGAGTFSVKLRDQLGLQVRAIDMSPDMVALARAKGIDACVGDVQALPFPDDSFDVVVANWMLYHVPDLDQALAEIARVLAPTGRLVAATMGPGMLHEVWDLVDNDGSTPDLTFSSTNGHAVLARRFRDVERRDLRGTALFPDRQAVVDYMHSTLTRAHLAQQLPQFEGPLRATTTNSVFVARTPIVGAVTAGPEFAGGLANHRGAA